jgi:hypothetical protein
VYLEQAPARTLLALLSLRDRAGNGSVVCLTLIPVLLPLYLPHRHLASRALRWIVGLSFSSPGSAIFYAYLPQRLLVTFVVAFGRRLPCKVMA